LDVEDVEPQQPVDIVIFASQCVKTYAKCVDDAYMMEFEQQKDSSAETAKGSNRPKKLG
jgi:hypothetical protein